MKLEDETARKAAIAAMRENNELTTQRLFLGKNRDDTMFLIMSDLKGNPRIMMSVTSDGRSKLEFLDDAGEVTHSLPAE